MAYPVSELIIDSWYLSNIVARKLETVDSTQVSDGLKLLNELLALKSVDIDLIPYLTYTQTNFVPNQEVYFFENLAMVATATYNIGQVRYPLYLRPRDIYFGMARVNNIQTLPSIYHVERIFNGANVYFYPIPQTNYILNIFGKYAFSEVTVSQDLSLTFDLEYIAYMRYALAKYMCEFYNVPFMHEIELAKRESAITDVAPIDLTMQKISSFKRKSVDYPDPLIYSGWLP